MNDTLAGASPVDQPVGRPCPKRYEGGRIKGGCSLHDAEKPELCQKALQSWPRAANGGLLRRGGRARHRGVPPLRQAVDGAMQL